MQPPPQLLINIVKVLAFRLEQCFDTFAALPVLGSSEARLFKHLSKHVFGSLYFQKDISYEGHLFLENV